MADVDSDCFMMEASDESDFLASSGDDENVAPPARKATVVAKKTAPRKEKKKTVAAADSSDEDEGGYAAVAPALKETGNKSSTMTKQEKTIEEQYQKKSQIEHILIRPDTYSKLFHALSCLIRY
jgi:hypothetical protein